jgi:glycosyltransferase involved in cell wall biosynthesis
MRALFYHMTDEWPGSSRAFLAAARGLAARGHDVTFACVSDSASEEHVLREGIDMISLPTGAVAGDAWRLRDVLKERTVDTVFLHTAREQLVVGSAMRLGSRGTVVRRVPAGAGFDKDGTLASRFPASALLFNSRDELTAAEKNRGSAPAIVAPLGVDLARYDDAAAAAPESVGATRGGRLIVCAYEPGARGRLFTAMRTMAVLAPRHPELHLVVVGPGSQDEELRLHAAAIGITPVVSFLGDRKDRLAIYAAADVGWVAARHDAAAFACLDFMALRVPVIVDRDPLSAQYVADLITGMLITARDASETAATVAAFLAKDEQRIAMGNAARARVAREFGESVMVDGFEQAAGARAGALAAR